MTGPYGVSDSAPALGGGATVFGQRSDGVFGGWDGGVDEVACHNSGRGEYFKSGGGLER